MLRFGTDGIRGVANSELTPELTLALGRAAARVLTSEAPSGKKARFLLGRDTRLSGPMLQAALSAGLSSEGVDVVDVGVLPTPGVAAMSASQGVPAAVISASHNPFSDNGIKLFEAGGRKLSDELEGRIEALLNQLRSALPDPGSALVGDRLGQITFDPQSTSFYAKKLLEALESRNLSGVRIALDCGNGAAYQVAPQVVEAAGAEVAAVIGVSPDGMNINEGCGSTDTKKLSELVLSSGADMGLAFDGDADRLIAVGHDGNVIDGDRIIALFAADLSRRGLLVDTTVVVTVMTNLGFHSAMSKLGIEVHQTSVGDRNVLEALDANGWSLGGEQSGHIIFHSLATTGDGILSGLLLADLMKRAKTPLSTLAEKAMTRFPQVLKNVEVLDRDKLEAASDVWAAVKRLSTELGSDGRVLLRPSGTEPVVRVMVEAPTEDVAESVSDELAEVVRSALGAKG